MFKFLRRWPFLVALACQLSYGSPVCGGQSCRESAKPILLATSDEIVVFNVNPEAVGLVSLSETSSSKTFILSDPVAHAQADSKGGVCFVTNGYLVSGVPQFTVMCARTGILARHSPIFKHQGTSTSAVLLPNSNYLAVAGSGEIFIIDQASGQLKSRVKVPGELKALVADHSGRNLYAAVLNEDSEWLKGFRIDGFQINERLTRKLPALRVPYSMALAGAEDDLYVFENEIGCGAHVEKYSAHDLMAQLDIPVGCQITGATVGLNGEVYVAAGVSKNPRKFNIKVLLPGKAEFQVIGQALPNRFALARSPDGKRLYDLTDSGIEAMDASNGEHLFYLTLPFSHVK